MSPSSSEDSRRRRNRRRQLEVAFGKALPESSTDEGAEGWGDLPLGGDGLGAESPDEQWLRGQVPPHSG